MSVRIMVGFAGCLSTHTFFRFSLRVYRYMTDIPLSKHSLGKLKYLKGSLRNAIFSKRRPHYVFGSKEYREEDSPICFPPLTDAFFMESLPTEGVMSQPRDLKRIDQLVKDLKPFLKPIKLGYVGNKNAMGQLHGKGENRFSYRCLLCKCSSRRNGLV